MQCRDLIRLENGGCIIRVRHGKGDKERYVPVMDAGVARKLMLLKQEQPGQALLLNISVSKYS